MKVGFASEIKHPKLISILVSNIALIGNRYEGKSGFELLWRLIVIYQSPFLLVVCNLIENYHPNFDKFAIESVIRQPSEFLLMMVNRLINGKIDRVGDVELLKLLQHVATHEHYSPTIRAKAQDYLNYQAESLS